MYHKYPHDNVFTGDVTKCLYYVCCRDGNYQPCITAHTTVTVTHIHVTIEEDKGVLSKVKSNFTCKTEM